VVDLFADLTGIKPITPDSLLDVDIDMDADLDLPGSNPEINLDLFNGEIIKTVVIGGVVVLVVIISVVAGIWYLISKEA
jgi:hypothetical protein